MYRQYVRNRFSHALLGAAPKDDQLPPSRAEDEKRARAAEKRQAREAERAAAKGEGKKEPVARPDRARTGADDY